jgi:cytochrome P450
MSAFGQIDFFSDPSLVEDPYAYFEYLREQGPVALLPSYGVVAVTGYDEAWAVYRDSDTFSSINAPTGPFPPLPFIPEGDDISEQLEKNRSLFAMNEHMATFDPPRHTAHRSLLSRLFTPKRLKQNEAFMWRLADRQLDDFIADDRCDLISQYSQPFTLLVICDFLGVPEEDHRLFQAEMGVLIDQDGALSGVRQDHSTQVVANPLEFLDGWFSRYVEDRRRSPRNDVLTHLATTTFPDGSLPEVMDIVHLATFLFFAGHETTAKLIAQSVRVLAEDPELQERMRRNRDMIPNFIEEVLRMEGPVKADFRLARRTTTLGGVRIPAGTTVMVAIGGANRDPSRFGDPHSLQPQRPNAREHISFARGVHTCPGAPLARTEARVSLERILDRMHDIRLSEEHHGTQGARRFKYVPTYVLRGLQELHLEFTPA